jgi:hypothetical protein
MVFLGARRHWYRSKTDGGVRAAFLSVDAAE